METRCGVPLVIRLLIDEGMGAKLRNQDILPRLSLDWKAR